MGLSINVSAVVLIFGTNWYRNCMGGGGWQLDSWRGMCR
jgi:hypothetical protein